MGSIERRAIHYPESDGAPLGETGIHGIAIARLFYVLNKLFHARADVYVGMNNFIYYEEGHPEQVVCPDLYVTFGTTKWVRNIWKVWEEGTFPHVVLEMISPSSRYRDVGEKRGLCGELGVEEYFVFDPLHEVKPPALRGWRRQGGVLMPIEPVSDAPVTLRSERLGVLLQEDGQYVRVIHGATGQPLPHWEEEWQKLEVAEQRQQEAQLDRDRTQAALAEAQRANERLAAEIARLRAEGDRHPPA